MIEKKDIEKLIVQHKKSNINNHWTDSFFYNATKYSGEVRENEILLWRSDLFLRGAYPIFHITFDQNDKMKGIKLEKNPFHKLLNKLSIGFFAVIIAFLFITSELRFAVIATCGILIIGFILRIVLHKSRKYEIGLMTDELKLTIQQIEQEKNSELTNSNATKPTKAKIKEWTLGKVLTRLILYPFCGLIVYFSIVGLIPEGKKILGISGVLIGLGYPIADLILAFGIKNYR